LHKIPIILKTPKFVARRKDRPIRYLFYDKVAIKERNNKKLLLGVVLTKSNVNVVWNLYWLENDEVPETVELIYKNTKKH
jgi:hypothetical protein